MTLSVPREEADGTGNGSEEHGPKSFLADCVAMSGGHIKVTCAKWSSRVSMLRVEFSAEFEQVVN